MWCFLIIETACIQQNRLSFNNLYTIKSNNRIEREYLLEILKENDLTAE